MKEVKKLAQQAVRREKQVITNAAKMGQLAFWDWLQERQKYTSESLFNAPSQTT